MSALHAPIPRQIQLHQRSATLELTYGETEAYVLEAEFLRVLSPSAEVRGHGGKGAVLQTGKRLVRIDGVEAAGNYALKLTFSDGHDSGIYSWPYLYDLCQNKERYWEGYLAQLKAANGSRD
ncbi:DUF971 domain-containing protein [Hahella sp. KA22]|uniref:gamma-butyrobetaine hydroxylase-like domain-containing protein n=1 Tax=Hahella sp. KA22 TaxID=1628392 RepID=UPI000FDE8884|nr:DUF971 domain-containing protein [Hahella sp. KA22]AZZ94408.1 DUF971 domain-containing protein [Hahella sp. KA22]QAY57782.1 DUF971 domain-containing protein [Hahella sp. KA22]